MLIHSGASIRRRRNSHAHVFVLQSRMQNAWLYIVLGGKNVALALSGLIKLIGMRTTPSRPLP